MLYREIIAVCFQIHTKHINALCGQNVAFQVRKIIKRQIIWWQTTKQDNIKKQSIFALIEYCLGISMEGMKNTANNSVKEVGREGEV